MKHLMKITPVTQLAVVLCLAAFALPAGAQSVIPSIIAETAWGTISSGGDAHFRIRTENMWSDYVKGGELHVSYRITCSLYDGGGLPGPPCLGVSTRSDRINIPCEGSETDSIVVNTGRPPYSQISKNTVSPCKSRKLHSENTVVSTATKSRDTILLL